VGLDVTRAGVPAVALWQADRIKPRAARLMINNLFDRKNINIEIPESENLVAESYHWRPDRTSFLL
jgi:hypothetical protein